MTRNVLIVEDEQALAKLLKRQMEELSCTVELAFAGDTGLRLAESKIFDLILLDIMLPGLDGLEVCRRLRTRRVYTPVLMLTARASEVDRVLGLEMGADDYLTKPFSMAELTARVKAIFRRVDVLSEQARDSQQPLRFGEALSIDPRSREVCIRGQPVQLTHKEFDLLLHFARNPGRVYTRAQLLDAVWGYSHEGYEHAVNCHVNRLRAKIERDQAKPDLLQTVWGVGYKFNVEGASA
ncbi:MAG TPA: response regulator transcription factor [Steroidobacteraceae bacterium]|nr:response regulator transcription factor [Steroidobacteraceae bacterium]